MFLINYFKFFKTNKLVGNSFNINNPVPIVNIEWTVGAIENLNRLLGVDAETELITTLSENLREEIDNQIINELNIGIEIGNQLLGRSSKITNFKFFN